jgi:RNA polymerase sigma-70 factor (sigma-E family)
MRAEDESEFRAFLIARAPVLRRMAFVLCGDWHHAEDLVQSTMIKLYGSWSRVRDRGKLDAYVRRTLVRVFVDESRRGWRRESPTPTVVDGVNPDERLIDDRLALVSALARVPARQRACIVLRYWEDLSVAATAEALGCSEGTVKSQTARGLQTLRGLMQPSEVAATQRKEPHG